MAQLARVARLKAEGFADSEIAKRVGWTEEDLVAWLEQMDAMSRRGIRMTKSSRG